MEESRNEKAPAEQDRGEGESSGIHPTTTRQVVKQLTDSGNAERFAEQHQHTVRYVAEWRKWLVWDGRRWKTDATAEAERLTKETVRSIYREAAEADSSEEQKAIGAHANKSGSAASRFNMLRLARSEKLLSIEPYVLDTDPWLLNCQNGTLNLKTLKLQAFRQDDYNTALCPVPFNPSATAPTWERFLSEIFAGNKEMIRFMQRMLGYTLTGSTSEQVLPIFLGEGANGKSTIIETMLSLLGPDYAAKAPSDLIAKTHNKEHPTIKMILRGRRFVAVNETDGGCKLSESIVKELTGGDTISARKMCENFNEFRPTHKLILATNHKPNIEDTDEGTWRRLRLVPFEVTIPPERRDGALLDKLRAELPGILAWCVKGTYAWKDKGLGVPPQVMAATADYRAEEDVLMAFVREHCETGPGMKVPASKLLEAYQRWSGDKAISQRSFGAMLQEHGIGKKTIGGYVFRIGLRLRGDNVGQCV